MGISTKAAAPPFFEFVLLDKPTLFPIFQCPIRIAPPSACRAIQVLLVPCAVLILHSNLITEHYLCTASFPASVSGSGKHEPAGRVDVDGGDDAAAVARDDGERDGAVAGRV